MTDAPGCRESARTLRPIHGLVALLACVVLPAASWLTPSTGPAWAMFTTSATYRLRIDVMDTAGQFHAIPPPLVFGAVGDNASIAFIDLGEWRHAPLFTLADHLADVGALACRVSRARAARVTLDVRAGASAPMATRTVQSNCP